MDKIKATVIFVIFFETFFFIAQNAFAALPEFHGFAEFAYGPKMSDDNTKRDDFNLLEQRLQLKTKYLFEGNGFLARKNRHVAS